ncbi:MAG: S41 family peptidase [Prevotellaceae bacterium]|nr:S41 family peptidase [Prevotellaceae bacterium]
MKKTKIILIALWVVFAGTLQAADKNDRYFEISKNLDVFNSLFRELDLFYVDTIDAKTLVRSAIDNMLEELDPYTTYIPESELKDFEYMTTGEYGGVGALIGKKGDSIIILEPYENMPAQKNDLRGGDVITEINGKRLKNTSVTDVSEMLKGQPGEVVSVTVKRAGKSIKKSIVREKIQINAVDYSAVYNNVGYIRLSGFTDKSSEELKRALTELKAKNELKGLVLDLRSNPGGIIDEAVNICSLFVPKGTAVVSMKGRDAQRDKTYKTLSEPIEATLPLVVLVNGMSASASEIVAGALQDLDRATIVGSRTFGKGLVQSTRAVGFNDYLKVTTAKYYTPSGRCIQEIDYEHKDEDGNAKRIPDSLTHEFKTAKGRTVRDGGGIAPDTLLAEPETLNITYRLVADYLIFDYVTAYVQKHPKIAPIDEFVYTDEEYEDFKKFLKQRKFTYELKSVELLKRLKDIIKIEGYAELSETEFAALEDKLKPDTDKDLEIFKTDIKELISIEIAKRYYYQKGEIRETLKYDEGLRKALEIINFNRQQ